ncbi:hypothetical protein [Streptomyces sp. NPDC055055]
MFGPRDETPQHAIDSAMSAYGPQLDQSREDYEYGLRQQIQLQSDMERDQMLGRGPFASSYDSPIPVEPEPFEPTHRSVEPVEERSTELLDRQEAAYHELLDTLTEEQRDALLTLSRRSRANALDQLLDALEDER